MYTSYTAISYMEIQSIFFGNISAINETTLEVTMSDTPVTTPVVSDFSITSVINNGNATVVTPTAISLNEKKVTLTVPAIPIANIDQNITYSVSYKGGEVKTATAVVAGDKTVPTIKTADCKFTDYKTLTLAFSEKVTGTPSIKLNGEAVDGANIALAADGMSLTISKVTAYSAGTYTVVVNGLKDAVGNDLAADSSVQVKKDASVFSNVAFTSTALSKASNSTQSTLAFKVSDQYKEEKTLSATEITFKALWNGVPVDTKTNTSGQTSVTFDSTMLVKDRSIDVTAYRTADDSSLVEIGKATFKVDEATAVPTTLSAVTVTQVNGSSSSNISDLKAGDTLQLTAAVKDQFSNAVTDLGWIEKSSPADAIFNGTDIPNLLRWTTSDKSIVAVTGHLTSDFYDGSTKADLAMGFTAQKEGKATITCYLPDGTAYKTFEVTVGKGSLATIDTSNAANVAITNKAALTAANVTVNGTEGKYLVFKNGASSPAQIPVTADSLTFTVTAPTGFNASDLTIEKAAGTDGYLTGLKVTSNRTALTDLEKAGTYTTGVTYTVTAHSSVTGVADQTFTVVSKIDSAVSSIDAITLGTTEVTAGNYVNKAVVFKNQYGETLNIKQSALALTASDANITSSTSAMLKGSADSYSAASAGTDIVTGIQFNAAGGTTAGDYTMLVASGVASRTVSFKVAEAAKITTVQLGSQNVSLITGDALDVATPSATDLVAVSGGKTYKLIAVTFFDQYGNQMHPLASQFDLSVTGTDDANKPVVELWNTITDATTGLADGAATEVKYIAVKAEAGDTSQTLTLQAKTEDNINLGTAITLNATVQATRALNAITVTPVNSTIVEGAKKVFEIAGVDQYGNAFEIDHAKVKMVAPGNSEYSAAVTDNGTKANVEITANTAGTYAAVIYYDDATTNDTKDANEKYINIPVTIKSAADAIDHITLQPTVTYDADTTLGGEVADNAGSYKVQVAKNDPDQNIAFTVKAYDANNNEVVVDQSSIIYTITANTVKYADDTAMGIVTSNFTNNKLTLNAADKDLTGSFTVRAATTTGKTSTLAINIDNTAAAAQAGTFFFATTATGVDENDASTKITSLTLNDTNVGSATIHLVAVDQYGKAMDINESASPVLATSIDNGTILGKTITGNSGITVSGKAAGSTTLRAIVDGNDPLALSVTVATADTTAATYAATYPKVGADAAVGTKKVNVLVKSSENSTAYLVALADGADAPTAAAVKANGSKVTATLVAGTEKNVELTGALDATAYDVYVVTEDAAGNLLTPVKVDVTTPAAS